MTVTNSRYERHLRIERLIETLIDLDTVLDDARREIDRAADQLRQAIAARDAAAAELQALIQEAA